MPSSISLSQAVVAAETLRELAAGQADIGHLLAGSRRAEERLPRLLCFLCSGLLTRSRLALAALADLKRSLMSLIGEPMAVIQFWTALHL